MEDYGRSKPHAGRRGAVPDGAGAARHVARSYGLGSLLRRRAGRALLLSG
jgi:hypothetical protein